MNISAIERLSNFRNTILLTGDSGVGKSRLARVIHDKSSRKGKKFISINLVTLSDSIFESELFGHTKGAFTGAHADRSGYFETVGDGTLFLDEIGELPLHLQKKLLMVLEERIFCRVGSCGEMLFKGRIIAATNQDLEKMVREGKFRQDLYYRLRVCRHHVACISSDKVELERFLKQFYNQFMVEYDFSYIIDEQCWKTLLEYSWPGNIREIKSCMECLVSLKKYKIGVADLPQWVKLNEGTSSLFGDSDDDYNLDCSRLPLNYKEALNEFEKRYLLSAMLKMKGQVNYASRSLGISKATLIAKMKKYAINIFEIKAKEIGHKNNEVIRKGLLIAS